jgi:hypothetical protein
VPEKGKAEIEKLFGESWDGAVQSGQIYNAKDAAKKLGVDAAGINGKWSKLSRGKDLLKYGGGFYCGKVGDIYVMNGFYMEMRAATFFFHTPFHYFLVVLLLLVRDVCVLEADVGWWPLSNARRTCAGNGKRNGSGWWLTNLTNMLNRHRSRTGA